MINLSPQSEVSPAELEAGKRSLVWDAAWGSVTGAWSGGVVLVAFALSIGAGPITIGLLAAIPFAAQAAQLPTIFLVEWLRQRKRISVTALTSARLIILLLAFLPFAPAGSRLAVLVGAQLLIGLLGAVTACSVNSWFHQLLPVHSLGKFFGKRLFAASLMACLSTLAVGFLVDHPPWNDANYAYAVAFAGAGLAGLVSSCFLARTPEPVMPLSAPLIPLRTMLGEPLRDLNFRSLLFVIGSWNLASNLVAPFLTVYLLQQLGYGLSTVTALWVTSQLANAVALYLWGKLSDRLSNKAILAVALPAFFVGTLGLVFANLGSSARFELLLLYLLHILMGLASGGISLAIGNLGLKLAPQHKGTSYLAVIGLVSALAGGIAPIAGGAIAQLFSASELTVVLRWMSPSRTNEVALLGFAHWEFLFAVSAVMGLYVMHALSRVQEGHEISERVVIQELALEALRTVNHLSSLGGVLGGVFSFAKISQWRRDSRLARRDVR
ncbi:MFS transporter [Variovorax sp. GT1P44]|uniref:MFS transporter n=1 Tax=Variovorax sp. GT1P44 TaxID=3443742 RepID=UPI003F465073